MAGQGRGVVITVVGASERHDIPTPPRTPTSIAGVPDLVEVDDVGPTIVAPASSVRTQVVVRNTDAVNDLALGYSADIGFGDASIVVPPGKSWVETSYKGDIYGITSSGVTLDAAVQQVGEFTP